MGQHSHKRRSDTGRTRRGPRDAAQTIATAVWRAVRAGHRADLTLSRLLKERKDLDAMAHAAAHRATLALCRWWGWVGRDEADLTPAIAAALRLDAGDRRGFEARRLEELFPDWLPDHLPPLSGAVRRDLLESLQRPPAVWIRAQGTAPETLADSLRAEGILCRAHPSQPRAYEVLTGGDLHRTAAFRTGRFEVQDLSSQLVATACAPRRGHRWWDVCAGAGGKTLALADIMQGGGTILATDPDSRKLEELSRRARRGGYSNIRTLEWSGEGLPRAAKRAGFDGVLVDAPCSNSGTWRRNPDARWRISREDIHRLAILASSILSAAARAVRPGGSLVYATCSLSVRENEDVVRTFLASSAPFALEEMRRLTPLEENADAMFLARMRRAAD